MEFLLPWELCGCSSQALVLSLSLDRQQLLQALGLEKGKLSKAFRNIYRHEF